MTKVATPRSRQDIRLFTNRIRELLEIEHYLPIVTFLESIMPLIFDNFIYEIVCDDELDCEALAYPNSNLIKIRESVYDGACNNNPRDRFTIAHEIGHMFLHNEKSISFARAKDRTIKPFESPEWQANTFAAEFLAPPHLIKGLSIEEIVAKCKVSQQVAEIQSKYC